MPTNTQKPTPAGQSPVLALAHGSADWQSQVDALIEHTRSFVALPTDACVVTSLAAQVLLARKQIELLRSALTRVKNQTKDYYRYSLPGVLHRIASEGLSPNVEISHDRERNHNPAKP